MFTSLEPAQLDSGMRAALADSLEYIFEETAGQLDLESQRCDRALQQIRTRKTDPGVFARYYDLVFAIGDRDFTRARRLIEEILERAGTVVDFDFIPYDEHVLGDDFQRFPRLVFAGYSRANPLGTPDQQTFESHAEKLKQAIAIIRHVDDRIAREVEALVSRIIVAVDHDGEPHARSFGGVTSFMTWGAIFINARHYASLFQVVEFLVHELTHCVLFSLGCREPLVLNDASERYPSPLRSDLRAMDGVYHATLVCARLVLFLQKWRQSATRHGELQSWLDARLDSNRLAFANGSAVIREHAKLSPGAGALFARANSLIGAGV